MGTLGERSFALTSVSHSIENHYSGKTNAPIGHLTSPHIVIIICSYLLGFNRIRKLIMRQFKPL